MNTEPTPKFSFEEWLASLTAAAADDDGYTMTEIVAAVAEHLHYSRDWTEQQMRKLFRQGRLETGRRREKTMAGTWGQVPVYRLKNVG